MTLHAKGYLASPLLLLLVLPALVVSRNPRQLSRAFNEASTAATRTTSTTARATLPSFDLLPPTSWAERQAAGGLQIGSRALIARPEKRSVTGAAPSISAKQMTMVVRRVRAGAEGYLAFARARLHQQSTNSAAAKRDLQYNKQRVARGATRGEQAAKAISGYFIPEMYHKQAELNDRLEEKRLEGQFLPGAINALESHELEDSSGFLPPRIIYVGQALSEPFVEPRGQRRGRVFGLSNFLIKGRPPMEPRSFEDEGELPPAATERSNAAAAAEATASIDQPSETTNLPPAATLSPRRVSSAARHRDRDSIEEDSLVPEENDDSATMPSFEDNFAEDDELAALTTRATPKAAEYHDHGAEDYDVPDWDVSESQKREVQHDSRLEASGGDEESSVEENGGGVYEFGYRVIDHATGSDFGHAESRWPSRPTEGRYHVLLPDGRLQRVEYSVGSDTGFRAEVYFETAEDGTVEDTRAQAAPITDSAMGAPVAPMKVTNDAPVAAASVTAGMIMAGAAKADTMDGTPAAMTGLTKVTSPPRKETEAEAAAETTLLVSAMGRQTTPKE